MREFVGMRIKNFENISNEIETECAVMPFQIIKAIIQT